MSGARAGRRIGFVGLGNMGGRMTRRLVAAGIRSSATTAGRAGEAVGAAAAESLGELCAETDVVLLSLPDSRAVEAVVLGMRPAADGLLAFARPGQVIIDLSTAAPSSTQRIHAALAERGVAVPGRRDLRRRRGRGEGHADDHGRRPGGGA